MLLLNTGTQSKLKTVELEILLRDKIKHEVSGKCCQQ